MDVLEFVSSLVGSLAWPVAVVVLVWVLRPELKHLAAGGVRRWKAGPVEIEYWDRERSEVRESIRRELPAAVGEGGELAAAGGLVEELAEVVEAAPAAAVLEAFTRIEVELRRIVEAGGVEADGLERMAARQLAHVAFRHGLVTAESVNAVEGLAVMRNLAAHGRAHDELDQTRAVEYLYLADAVLYALRSAPPPREPDN